MNTVFTGDNAENYFSWGHLDFIKKEKVFNWRTHVTRILDVIKLKSQPKTPEIEIITIINKTIFTRTADSPFLPVQRKMY